MILISLVSSKKSISHSQCAMTTNLWFQQNSLPPQLLCSTLVTNNNYLHIDDDNVRTFFFLTSNRRFKKRQTKDEIKDLHTIYGSKLQFDKSKKKNQFIPCVQQHLLTLTYPSCNIYTSVLINVLFFSQSFSFPFSLGC